MLADQALQPLASSMPRCRFCSAGLSHIFVDLGMSPLCQTHIEPHELNHMEPFYPLRVWLCTECFLVQLEEYVKPADIFTDYAYFSSYADSWVEHAHRYALAMTDRLGLGRASMVMEIASNDGYLLQHFVKLGIPCLGIEPAENVAAAAVTKGVPTVSRFFGIEAARDLTAEHRRPDLLIGNNVLAHVPDINDFVAGMKLLLKPSGIATMEFPHLLQLMANNQFDTIYHEHFSYLSFTAVERIFARHDLAIFDVEEIPTHGGSLRIFACHSENAERRVERSVSRLKEVEQAAGLTGIPAYTEFQERVQATKRDILTFLIDAKRRGKRVVGYGAPGKGNTLLNYCGIRTDFLDYTVDRSPHKQGRYTPGTHIPILDPDRIRQSRPDFVFLLPWNLKDEIVQQLAYIRQWGGRFVVPIPHLTVID